VAQSEVGLTGTPKITLHEGFYTQ